jgi:hypothetical protein
MTTNGAVIEAEIAWFRETVDLRLDLHAREADGDLLASVPVPDLGDLPVPYADGVREAGLTPAERLVLMLALLPHLRPQALDHFLIQNDASKRRFTEFGGAEGGTQHGFRPTRETALFLLAGENMDRRFAAMQLFAPEAPLQARRILETPEEPGEAGPWAPLTVSQRWIARLTTGTAAAPRFGPLFPAQLLETPYALKDVVVGQAVREDLDDLLAWVRNEKLLMDDWGLRKHLKPGYRALFHGPPGTERR